jgi:hypothetical protein
MGDFHDAGRLLLIGWTIVGMLCLVRCSLRELLKIPVRSSNGRTRQRVVKTMFIVGLAMPSAENAVLASPVINLGVYDPAGIFRNEPAVKIEHVFISWADYHPGDLLRQLHAIESRGRRPLVSIEPWADSAITPLSSTLLAACYHRKVRSDNSGTGHGYWRVPPDSLRALGQEMENVTGRYPWAVHDAELYKNAYRHFVTICRQYAHNTCYIWSPVGDNGCEHYWPGSAFVDFVGLSVFGFPQFDLRYYHKVRSFNEQMSEKYRRIETFQKPVKLINWEVPLFQLARWPWVVRAIVDATRCAIAKTTLEWRVTPKTGAISSRIPLQWFVPYILIVIASLIVTTLWVKAPETRDTIGSVS